MMERLIVSGAIGAATFLVAMVLILLGWLIASWVGATLVMIAAVAAVAVSVGVFIWDMVTEKKSGE